MGSTLATKTELTPEQQKYLNSIQSAANDLLNLITDILNFSSLETESMPMNPLHFDLNVTINVTISACKQKNPCEGIFARG
jgi:polar amino acid transport system substrate-binding protein